MNFNTLLALIICGVLGIIFLLSLGDILFDLIIRDSIYRRKIPQYRIIEYAKYNSLTPPGDKFLYSIEGKTNIGIWLDIFDRLFNDVYYNTLNDAQLAISELEYNQMHNWEDSHDFDDIIKEVKQRKLVNLKVMERKKCLYQHNTIEKNDHYKIITTEKIEDCFKDLQTFYKTYKLYKHTIFGWKLVCNGNFDVIDKQIREFNYISQSKIIA